MKHKKEVIGCLFVIGIMVITLVFLVVFSPNVSGDRLDVFKAIPEKPDDFDAYTRDIWKGAFVELCDIGEEYWKQPEFYGSAWENGKKSFYDKRSQVFSLFLPRYRISCSR